jgi:hypothetical protein
MNFATILFFQSLLKFEGCLRMLGGCSSFHLTTQGATGSLKQTWWHNPPLMQTGTASNKHFASYVLVAPQNLDSATLLFFDPLKELSFR